MGPQARGPTAVRQDDVRTFGIDVEDARPATVVAPQRGEQTALRRIDGRVRRDAPLPRAHECEVAVAGVGVRRREIVAAGLAEGRKQATELRGRF